MTECCRLVFATAALLGPCVIFIFLVFEEARRSIGQVLRPLREWQLYASILTVGAVSFVLLRSAERGAQRLLRFLPDEPPNPPLQRTG